MLARPLQAYRAVLRSARIAFKDDAPMLANVHHAARTQFEANRDASSEAAVEMANYAREIADVLRTQVVQGKKEGDVYKLRIHDDIERGDNETIKHAMKGKVTGGGGCCSQP